MRAEGWYALTSHGDPFTGAGRSDLICCAEGRFVVVEMKTATGQPSAQQVHHILQVRAAGGCAFLGREPATIIRAIKAWLHGRRIYMADNVELDASFLSFLDQAVRDEESEPVGETIPWQERGEEFMMLAGAAMVAPPTDPLALAGKLLDEGEAEPAKPKRRRRTKAEIEAAKQPAPVNPPWALPGESDGSAVDISLDQYRIVPEPAPAPTLTFDFDPDEGEPDEADDDTITLETIHEDLQSLIGQLDGLLTVLASLQPGGRRGQ